MPPQLVAITEGPNILLDKPILLIGRHQECDIQIPSRKISRRHCCIAQVNDHLVVRDLCSTNGLRINGVRVLEGNLKEGDELTIGNYRYQVSLKPAAADAQAKDAISKETQPRPLPALATDDAVLESCEEPIPLEEPAQPLGAPPLRSLPLPPPGAAAAAMEKPASSAGQHPLPSFVLPENIELAPSSHLRPPFPKTP